MTARNKSNRSAFFLSGMICMLLMFFMFDFFRSKDNDQRTGIKSQLTDKEILLFLDKGQRVVFIETRTGTTTNTSRTAALDFLYPVYLWQDAATASTAEVFIAALTDNGQGVSIRKTTFGKGTKQDIIKLSNGSALILTTGRLITPKEITYQGRGLEPIHRLKKEFAETAGYLLELTHSSFKNSVSCAHILTGVTAA